MKKRILYFLGLYIAMNIISIVLPISDVYAESMENYTEVFTVGGNVKHLNSPRDLVVDRNGFVYVADTDNHCIKKYNSNGVYITKWGSKGNGIGQFDSPMGIELDNQGNIYVIDTFNDRVQKFSNNGIFISSFGSSGSGIGQFSMPRGIDIDDCGNIYVVDNINKRIQKFNSDGIFLSQVNIDYDYDFGSTDVTVDKVGNMYVTCTSIGIVRKFDSSGLFLTDLAGFNFPIGLSLDNSGNVLVTDISSDSFNNKIKKIAPSGIVTTLVTPVLNQPSAVSIDNSGNIYVADTENEQIQKLDSNGSFITKWGNEDTANGEFKHPIGVELDNDGNIYIVDLIKNLVQKFDNKGNYITKWGIRGDGPGNFYDPIGIALDSKENVYVVDSMNSRIQIFDKDGTFVSQHYDSSLMYPSDIAIDNQDNLYVTNYLGINKYDSIADNWIVLGTKGTEDGRFNYPQGLALDSNGDIYIADTNNNRIQKISSDGVFIIKWGRYGNGDGQFIKPNSVAIDKYDNIYVTDSENNRIQKFNSNGEFIEKYSDENKFLTPTDIIIDSNGAIYITNKGNGSLVKLADITKPTLTHVSISSKSTTSSAIARVGDIVTINITASEEIISPIVTISGIQAVVSDAGDSNLKTWTASRIMQDSDTEGEVTFTIDFSDLVGNVGNKVTSTTDNSSVIFDKIEEISISPNISINQSKIKANSSSSFTINFGTGASLATSANITSSDENIVTVDNIISTTSGQAIKFTGVRVGTANITVVFNDVGSTIKTIAVTVEDEVLPDNSSHNSTKITYKITGNKYEGGNIKINASTLEKGKSTGITIIPDEGYRIVDVLINGVSVGPVESYSIEKITSNIKIEAIFEKIVKEDDWSNPFDDVLKNKWYYNAVVFVSKEGLFMGTSDSSFSPNSNMTRGMFATVLGRLHEMKNVKIEKSNKKQFNDVGENEYYVQYAAWISENGIANGVGNNLFAPEKAVTREQMVVMLYNYAKYVGMDVTNISSGSLEQYSDYRRVSSWSKEAMNWAITTGIVTGKDNNVLGSQDLATRAEIASIIQRFVEKMKE